MVYVDVRQDGSLLFTSVNSYVCQTFKSLYTEMHDDFLTVVSCRS